MITVVFVQDAPHVNFQALTIYIAFIYRNAIGMYRLPPTPPRSIMIIDAPWLEPDRNQTGVVTPLLLINVATLMIAAFQLYQRSPAQATAIQGVSASEKSTGERAAGTRGPIDLAQFLYDR